MGGPDMAPQTPPRSDAPRPGRGAPRSHGADSGGPDMAPQTPPRSDAPRPGRGAPRSHGADSGGPDMAPQTPPRSDAPRPGRGAPRSHGADSGGPDMAPQTPQRSDARWRSRGAPCSGDAGLGGPDMVRRTPRRSDAASLGGAEMMGPRLPGGLARPGGAGALFDILRAPTELLEDGLELELAADRAVGFYDLEAGHRVVVNVAVLVEVPLAVDTLEVLGGGDRLAHRLTLLGDVLRLLDRRRGSADAVDRDAAGLDRVERVRRRLFEIGRA